MLDCTDESGRSTTDRHAVGRLSSESALIVAGDWGSEFFLRVLRVWMMLESGLSLDLKGRTSVEDSDGDFRRFFAAAPDIFIGTLRELGLCFNVAGVI